MSISLNLYLTKNKVLLNLGLDNSGNCINTGCFFNSVFYDLALIQSFFRIIEIVRTFFHSIHRRIFKNVKTLLIGQILV